MPRWGCRLNDEDDGAAGRAGDGLVRERESGERSCYCQLQDYDPCFR